MSRYMIVMAAVVAVAIAVPGRPVSQTGSWIVDARRSSAHITTDGTTDFGKTKTTFTIGVGRINGEFRLDSSDPAKSSLDLHIYPSTDMVPSIDEGGKFLSEWLSNSANNTLMCFHAKGLTATSDGKLKATGNLVLTRVDRNVELTANEAYSGPIYGEPIIHKQTHEATFIIDQPAAAGDGQKSGGLVSSGSTTVAREDFPELAKTLVSTYWPPVVQDRHCSTPAAGEGFAGSQCTGSFVMTPARPIPPGMRAGEDYPGPQNFNTVTGDRVKIALRLNLITKGGAKTAGD